MIWKGSSRFEVWLSYTLKMLWSLGALFGKKWSTYGCSSAPQHRFICKKQLDRPCILHFANQIVATCVISFKKELPLFKNYSDHRPYLLEIKPTSKCGRNPPSIWNMTRSLKLLLTDGRVLGSVSSEITDFAAFLRQKSIHCVIIVVASKHLCALARIYSCHSSLFLYCSHFDL